MAVAVQAASVAAGRSNNIDFAAGYVSPATYNPIPFVSSPASPSKKLTLSTSAKSLGHASKVGFSPTSPRAGTQKKLRGSLRSIDTNMSSYTSTTTVPASTTRSDSPLQKLHKRTSSNSSLPNSPSPLSGPYSQFATPFATQEEPFPDISSTPPPQSSTPRIKPYLRKLSSQTKEDENQGRLDLSKSVSENGGLAGLGIQDYGARTASDVNFSHVPRKSAHSRTTSNGSQMSAGSGSFKPTQPYLHPLRQMPITPSASSLNDDETRESSDIVTDDDVQVGQAFRNRSTSISSTPLTQPTPLSQAHTAADLGEVPKLTNRSQTDLSIISARSSKSRLGRPRGNTDGATSPSSRTSLDKALFGSRRSDPDPQTRDARIRAARRAFEEKEANKDRKMEQGALKRRETDEAKDARRQERQRRKSEASQSDRTRISKPSSKSSDVKRSQQSSTKQSEELQAKSYDETRPPPITALPILGREPGVSEKTMREQRQRSNVPPSSWKRFSTWTQTRILSCGGKG